MNTPLNLSLKYNMLRQQNVAWKLLTAKRAPLILACAEKLFLNSHENPSMEDAIQVLAKSFEEFKYETELEIGTNVYALAKQEWKSWLKKGLIIEKDNQVFATDALQRVIIFIQSLDEPSFMTSTASRLETVQAEVQKLYIALNPNQEQREKYLEHQIQLLQKELELVKQGSFLILSDEDTEEKIKNIYQLAMSLYHDFRRVEDSYREMDQRLRENVIREQYHRGQVITELLDSHDMLINTPEGRVFQSFNQALQREELELFKQQIRSVLKYSVVEECLNSRQQSNLYYLTRLLNKEAGHVIRARQRIEKDVRSFIQTGLATEHHRVGELLKQVFNVALSLNWQDNQLRQTEAWLPPVGIALDKVNVIERLIVKEIKLEQALSIDLNHTHHVDILDTLDDSFWQSFDGLDRRDWFEQTWAILESANRPMSLGELSQVLTLPIPYDLEAITMWLEIAHSSQAIFSQEYEILNCLQKNGELWQFKVPLVYLSMENMQHIDIHDI